jgi:hypothetical protein
VAAIVGVALTAETARAGFTYYASSFQQFTGNGGVSPTFSPLPSDPAWNLIAGAGSFNPPPQIATYSAANSEGAELMCTVSGDYESEFGENSLALGGVASVIGINPMPSGIVSGSVSIVAAISFRVTTAGRYDISGLAEFARSMDPMGFGDLSASAQVRFQRLGDFPLMNLQTGAGLTQGLSLQLPNQLLQPGDYGLSVRLSIVNGTTFEGTRTGEARFGFNIAPVPAPGVASALGAMLMAGGAVVRRRS